MLFTFFQKIDKLEIVADPNGQDDHCLGHRECWKNWHSAFLESSSTSFGCLLDVKIHETCDESKHLQEMLGKVYDSDKSCKIQGTQRVEITEIYSHTSLRKIS